MARASRCGWAPSARVTGVARSPSSGRAGCGHRALATTSVGGLRAAAEAEKGLERLGGARPAVALGKFDALHRGHAALALAAGALGEPTMLRFSGMAEVLGWAPRPPLVAPCDRARVLGALGARERVLPFADVRSLSPEAFVELLAGSLGARAAVCGANFRFGYKAAGDAEALRELGARHGIRVHVVDLVGDAGDDECVSSTRVRAALAAGDVAEAARMLGRPHRVVWESRAGACWSAGTGGRELALAEGGARNQAPADGEYAVTASLGAAETRATLVLDGARAVLRLREGEGNPEWAGSGGVLLDFDGAGPGGV